MVLPQGGSTFVSGGSTPPLRGGWINPCQRRTSDCRHMRILAPTSEDVYKRFNQQIYIADP